MDRKSSFRNSTRKKFSDITDSVQAISENLPQDFGSAKEYIDILVKEKMVLAKIVHEKNKVLESNGTEIHNLTKSLLMMRLHNWNLAQSNSQMLTELSLGREKLKALQHDLVCKEALLKAKNLELKETDQIVRRKYEFTSEDGKSYNANKSRSSKTQSLGGSPLFQPHSHDKQAVGINRRYCSRRRSASSRIQHQEPDDIFYDIDYNTTFPIAMRSNSSNHDRLPCSSFYSRSSLKFNLTRKDQLRSR